MRVEIPALARQCLMERRRVNSAWKQMQGRFHTEPDAVAKQVLIVPRALDREQTKKNRNTCPKRQLRCARAC
jgi:hypothetical protein